MQEISKDYKDYPKDLVVKMLVGPDEELASATSTTIHKNVKPNLLKMLHSEHSPIRTILFTVECILPVFVATHFVRHGATGQLHFQETQRDDRDGVDNGRWTQSKYKVTLNAQHLIDISKKRLCSKSAKETVYIWKQILKGIFEYIPELKEVCMPTCDYRGGVCHEFSTCGYKPHYMELA